MDKDNLTSHELNEQKRKKRLEEKMKHRSSLDKTNSIKKAKIAIITVVCLVAIFFIIYMFNKSKVAAPGQYDAFATCITESGATMYGTDWCSHCQDQKKMFGNSFSKIVFVNCDKSRLACESAGVASYPTWVFGDGATVSGTQSFTTLAQKSGCALPN